MKLLTPLLTTALLASTLCAGELRDLEGYFDTRGDWRICIETERVRSLPDFDPEKEPPPVSIPEAIAEAKRSLSRQFPEVKQWDFSEIAFERVKCSGLEFWRYTVRFYADPGTDQIDVQEAWVAMDGAALVRKFVKRKDWPNKRTDGTSAKAPPSKPSQGAAVPHP